MKNFDEHILLADEVRNLIKKKGLPIDDATTKDWAMKDDYWMLQQLKKHEISHSLRPKNYT